MRVSVRSNVVTDAIAIAMARAIPNRITALRCSPFMDEPPRARPGCPRHLFALIPKVVAPPAMAARRQGRFGAGESARAPWRKSISHDRASRAAESCGGLRPFRAEGGASVTAQYHPLTCD